MTCLPFYQNDLCIQGNFYNDAITRMLICHFPQDTFTTYLYTQYIHFVFPEERAASSDRDLDLPIDFLLNEHFLDLTEITLESVSFLEQIKQWLQEGWYIDLHYADSGCDMPSPHLLWGMNEEGLCFLFQKQKKGQYGSQKQRYHTIATRFFDESSSKTAWCYKPRNIKPPAFHFVYLVYQVQQFLNGFFYDEYLHGKASLCGVPLLQKWISITAGQIQEQTYIELDNAQTVWEHAQFFQKRLRYLENAGLLKPSVSLQNLSRAYKDIARQLCKKTEEYNRQPLYTAAPLLQTLEDLPNVVYQCMSAFFEDLTGGIGRGIVS